MRHQKKTITVFALSDFTMTRVIFFTAGTAQKVKIQMPLKLVVRVSKRPICLISMMTKCGGLRTDEVKNFVFDLLNLPRV